jgi:predicted secreted hydrolase
MRRDRRLLGVGLLAAALAACGRPAPPPAATVSVAQALGAGATEGYARATAPRDFTFPTDHGPHPAFRTEWWYYTGNLASAGGRHVGYQLTFFRVALAPAVPPRDSAWAARDVYLAHLAVTDTAGGRFHAVQRAARGAAGLAGAAAAPFHVWLEDWSAAAVGGDAFPVRLVAAEGEVAVDLVLERGKPPVLHGERGLSRKGAGEGNASFYYSLTRMPTRGTVRLGGERLAVTGQSWMDREWSTSALGDNVGWDWFALQLADGREVMFYQLRRPDGAADPLSAGTVVAADGTARPLALADVRLEVLGHWTSPRGGARYPARWRLGIPREGLSLEIVPRLADQEHPAPLRYWEGAVTARSGALQASGYVELVGYAAPAR